jgi:hypothetical protein
VRRRGRTEGRRVGAVVIDDIQWIERCGRYRKSPLLGELESQSRVESDTAIGWAGGRHSPTSSAMLICGLCLNVQRVHASIRIWGRGRGRGEVTVKGVGQRRRERRQSRETSDAMLTYVMSYYEGVEAQHAR